ncbi:MAG: sigma-70 family RNA polymerase sigma factor [Ruminococcaceae bacterium]|nr:sigma-70 family RNA polymerase sigma factor [Oscillospiraceae bacterium]
MAVTGKRSDEELVLLAKGGDTSALEKLLSRYANAFRENSFTLSSLGLDSDDIAQESMLAVVEAVRSFSSAKQVSFKTFVLTCISNRIYSLLRSHAGKKHSPLNERLPLKEIDSCDTLQFSLKFSEDPEALVIKQEHDRHIWQQIDSVLSDFECAAFKAYLSGYSYEEMAKQFGCSVKSIDNALHRSKLKLKSIEF